MSAPRAAPVLSTLLLSGLASPTVARAEDAAALAAKLVVAPRAAGQRAVLPADLGPYVAARRALREGRPTSALEAFADVDVKAARLLSDREALLRGDALRALGALEEARVAYRAALDAAAVPSVARGAMRGLLEIERRAERPAEALIYVDALLAKGGGPSLRLARAELLAQGGASKAAHRLARRLERGYPGSDLARRAKTLADRLETEAELEPLPFPPSAQLAYAERCLDRGHPALAASALTGLDDGPQVRLLRGRIAEALGDRPTAEALYAEAAAPGAPRRLAADALWRLGRGKLRADDNEGAAAVFDRLAKRAPGTPEARKGLYLAAWVAYDAGRYAEARARMLAYAARFPRARDRDEALWYAAWASYLGGERARSRATLAELVAAYPRSALVPQALYWRGRSAQRLGDEDAAAEDFRAVLDRDPLGYYGLWAAHRLTQQGHPVPHPAAPPDRPSAVPLDAAVAALGPSRPTNVDRAVHLERADHSEAAVEELESVRDRLVQGSRETVGRVAELLHQLGAHNLAFKAAVGLVGSGHELGSGDDDAWRAWRGAYPRAFEAAVALARDEHRVDPTKVWAVMRTESHYAPRARSPVGARGLMQLMPATARQIGRSAEGGRLHATRYGDPESNIWLGAWYLSQLEARYGGQLVAAVGAYNGGPTAMDRWLADFDGMPLDEFVERVPYRETRRYIRRVLETWSVYQQLYRGRRPALPAAIRQVVDVDARVSF